MLKKKTFCPSCKLLIISLIAVILSKLVTPVRGNIPSNRILVFGNAWRRVETMAATPSAMPWSVCGPILDHENRFSTIHQHLLSFFLCIT